MPTMFNYAKTAKSPRRNAALPKLSNRFETIQISEL